MSRLKILFLEQYSQISGGQKCLLELIDGLDQSCYECYLALPDAGELLDEIQKRGIKYFILPIGKYSLGRKNFLDVLGFMVRNLFLVFLLIRLIRKYRFDLIYANAPRTFVFGTFAAKICGIPILWHLHIIIGGIERRICRIMMGIGVSKVIVVSNTVKRVLIKPGEKLEEKIDVVYNGIDASKFNIVFEDDKFRKEIGVARDCNLIGYIGRIAAGKGIEDLILAAEKVIEEVPNTKLLIVGAELFNLGKHSYKDELVALIKALGLMNCFIFTGGRKDIANILASIDVLVVPSRAPESFGLVVLEGMASGKVVIASNQGGPAEIIKDGFDGILFEPRNHNELSAKLIKLLRTADEIKMIGKNARRTVLERYTVNNYRKKIERNILDAVNKRRG